jgi:Uma2 family endonuclease
VEATQKDERYTYADYALWDDETRYELIDGVAYAMARPSIAHQSVSMALSNQLYNYLQGKPCVVLSEVDVRLNAEGQDDTVVVPDILVVCDKNKLEDGAAVNGAPDVVIEILSPSSTRHDRFIKFQKYQQAGVREYWIVDPGDKTVWVNILDNGRYYGAVYADTDLAPVHVLQGCSINLADVFAQSYDKHLSNKP